MARVIGQAGRGAAIEAIFGTGEPVFIGILLITGGGIACAVLPTIADRLWLVAGMVIGTVMMRRAVAESLRHAVGSRNWWRGYEGEKRTGEELAKLGDEYVVFHDYSFRSGADWFDWNVDHIVVGPTGVFVLETKNPSRQRIHSARLDTRTERDVRQVKRNAMSLKERLQTYSNGQLADVFVEGWLVYAQGEASVEELWEGYTHVVPLRLLNKHVQGRRKRDVDAEQVYRIARALYSLTYPGRQERFREVMQAIEKDQRLRVAQRIAEAKAKRAEPAQPAETQVERCPWCGAELVQKTAHSGRPDEHDFMSCSRFPDCRYGHDLPRATASTA